MVDQLTPQILSAPAANPSVSGKAVRQQLKSLSLRKKMTAIALLLGTFPVLGVGAVGYRVAEEALERQVTSSQEVAVVRLSDLISRYMIQRYNDVQVIAGLPILADPNVSDYMSIAEKDLALDRIVENAGTYSNLILFDLAGNVLIQTAEQKIQNQAGQPYFQTTLKENKPIIAQPVVFADGRPGEIYITAPVKDVQTGKTIALLRADIALQKLAAEIKTYTLVGREYRIVDSSNQVFLSSKADQTGRNVQKDIPEFTDLQSRREVSSRILKDEQMGNQQLLTYGPSTRLENLPDLNWQILLSNNTDNAFKAKRQLFTTLQLGTLIAAALAGLIGALLANRLAGRILSTTKTVQNLGQGDLDARLDVSGNDEIATLGKTINQMAAKLQTLLNFQTQTTDNLKRFNEATFNVRRSLDFNSIMQTGVSETRRLLNCDRTLIYLFDDNWQGTIVAESVGLGFPASLGASIADPCFAEKFVERYRQGRVHAIPDLAKADLDPCYRGQLETFLVKANIVAPMVVEGRLLGLLVAHQCSGPRHWTPTEVDLLYQMAVHLGYSLGQVILSEQRQKTEQMTLLAEERRQQKETLQEQLMALLQSVEKAAMGDLTVRANVGAGEIGTVADFFNAIVENLQQLVQQVQSAATEVNHSLSTHDDAVRSLSQEAQLQTEETTATLSSVEQMMQSIQTVAQSAQQAARVSQTAATTAEVGGLAMDRTVQSIVKLRQTVGETAKKVKRLGESSQQISKVVSLINQIAIQTNLLAINAGIEAARAGEESQGFAAVAEEVGALAARASEATQEIEQLVANIQRETSEVVDAMEQGTTQVVEGTQLVENAKQSLEQIVDVSYHIDQLVQSISIATESQVETSQTITDLMQKIAEVAARTSQSSVQVSASLHQTVEIAQELQTSVGTFKIA